MKRLLLLGATWVALGGLLPSASAATVQVTGQVARTGAHTWPEGTRLAQVLLAAQVQPDAYVKGAAWFRHALQPGQQRLKAQVMTDLVALGQQATQTKNEDLAGLARTLHQQVEGWPVTGRALHALLDPRPLEVAAHNPLLAEGDRVWFPARPTTVWVTGAVRQGCVLPHRPLQDARDYLAACPMASRADPDWLYVIQPDGAVVRLGRGPWNRAAPQALAPGAVLYVPLRARDVKPIDPQLNDRLAQFLATLPLSETAP